jgi:hypothetical protein
MATWDDVARLALALPETSADDAHGHGKWQAWKVKGKAFVWERPLGRSDLKALGDDAPPDGPILATRVEHDGAKRALIESDGDVYFTIPHFDGFPAILLLLDRIAVAELEEVVTEAWLDRAPPRVLKAYMSERAGASES